MKRIFVTFIFSYIASLVFAYNLYDSIHYGDNGIATKRINVAITDFCRDFLCGFDNEETQQIKRIANHIPRSCIGFIYNGREYVIPSAKTVQLKNQGLNFDAEITINFYAKIVYPDEWSNLEYPYALITDVTEGNTESSEALHFSRYRDELPKVSAYPSGKKYYFGGNFLLCSKNEILRILNRDCIDESPSNHISSSAENTVDTCSFINFSDTEMEWLIGPIHNYITQNIKRQQIPTPDSIWGVFITMGGECIHILVVPANKLSFLEWPLTKVDLLGKYMSDSTTYLIFQNTDVNLIRKPSIKNSPKSYYEYMSSGGDECVEPIPSWRFQLRTTP